jgi:hypothetical protein
MSVLTDNIKGDIDKLISTYNGSQAQVAFSDVLGAFPNIAKAYAQVDAIFGSGNTAPSVPTPANGVADFATQYLEMFHIDALRDNVDYPLAKELYDLYVKKFSSALYALFSTVSEVNRKFGGFDPQANQISDEIIIPSFIEEATEAGQYGLPATMSGSFVQPTSQFIQKLSTTKTTTDTTPIGWVDHYFTFDSSLAQNALYEGSPQLDKYTSFIIFGALDVQGSVYAQNFMNAKNTASKGVYFADTGLNITTGHIETVAHVLNTGMSLYVGQSSTGYMGISIKSPIGNSTTPTTIDVRPLGLMFSLAPVLINNLY